MQRFQLNSSQLFLTYPECPIDKEECLQFLLTKLESIEEYIIARELHKNGNYHLHVYLKLSGPYRTSDSRALDLPQGYHGNYQGCRSSKNVIKYCTKAEDYLSNIDVPALLQKTSSRKADMDELITKKRTLEELIREKPQYLFNYASLSNSLKLYFEAQEDPKDPVPFWLPNPWGKVLPFMPETTKRRHFHIYSAGPNAGKTTWAQDICDKYGGIIVSNKEPYWNVTLSHRFIFLDEFNTARLRFDELNAMADGTYSFRRFHNGLLSFPKSKRPIIIILSNVHLDTLYPFMHETIYARYKTIDVSKFKF